MSNSQLHIFPQVYRHKMQYWLLSLLICTVGRFNCAIDKKNIKRKYDNWCAVYWHLCRYAGEVVHLCNDKRSSDPLSGQSLQRGHHLHVYVRCQPLITHTLAGAHNFHLTNVASRPANLPKRPCRPLLPKVALHQPTSLYPLAATHTHRHTHTRGDGI